METNIQKWGNSLGVRIPKTIVQQLSLHPGSIVDMAIENDKIVLYPKKYNLSEMLSNITKSNMHHPKLDDEKVGKEEW
jgi:antitoxin MazE